MFKIKNGTKNLFLFCKDCWNYQNFLFNSGIYFDKNYKTVTGACEKCGYKQEIPIKDIKKYYDDVNKDNIIEE